MDGDTKPDGFEYRCAKCEQYGGAVAREHPDALTLRVGDRLTVPRFPGLGSGSFCVFDARGHERGEGDGHFERDGDFVIDQWERVRHPHSAANP